MPIGERAVHRNIDLTMTQEEILPVNPQRRYALIVNYADVDCFLSLGIPAVASQGIPLTPAGSGSFEINLTNPFHGRIYAVSLGNAKRLMITEY